MNNSYQKKILNMLLDRYERRGLYNDEKANNSRAVTLNVAAEFSNYKSSFHVEEVSLIDTAIDALISQGVISGKKDDRGMYGTLRLCIPAIADVYMFTQRTPIINLRQEQMAIFRQFESRGGPVLSAFCRAQIDRLVTFKTVGFGIGDNFDVLKKVIAVLQAIENLEQETYIRNFSEAIFHDSKQFQKLRSTIENILCEFGNTQVDPKRILEQYNLFDNPGYIYIKGQLNISYPKASIDVSEISGGIALPSCSLEQIQHITVTGGKLITVENLTTFHDTDESSGAAILYLGGFLNKARRLFLQRTYRDNNKIPYFHKGDIDVYGFLILEHLKSKTSIPFQPMEMDLETLQYCFSAGHYKSLTEKDVKAMKAPELTPYKDILRFMVDHDCKIEQECFKAIKIFQTDS